MSAKTRPSVPGQPKRIPRRGWRELRQEFGKKKARKLIKGLKDVKVEN